MHEPQISILLATYNGESYLKEQLDSILGQTHRNWKIVASDDGSSDRTVLILEQYQAQIYQGPSQGFAPNFLSLLSKVSPDSDYYAFADQDDVWESEKLERAIKWLKNAPKDKPALYCGRTHLVNDKLITIGYSPLFKKEPNFKNALVQNIGGGNTMVFNKAALNILRQTKNHNDIVSHDWWAYLLVSGAGGAVFYDPEPYILYRQHNANLVGSNSNWMARIHRIKMLFNGRLKRWIDLNNSCLFAVSDVLTPENKLILEQFQSARQSSLGLRLRKIKQLEIYRQTIFGQLGLMIGILFNKI